MTLVLWIWVLYLLLLPIYVFKSGNIQPAHLVFLLGLAMMLIQDVGGRPASAFSLQPVREAIVKRGRLVCTLFFVFVVYVAIVNALWALRLSSVQPFAFTAFQVYNLLLVYFIYRIAQADFFQFARYTRIGFGAALALILAAVAVGGIDSAARESGFFNNPNQLAFFCLSSCMVFYVIDRLSIGSTFWNRFAIGVSCFICLLSLSRAGLVGCGVVLAASVIEGAGRGSRVLAVSIVGGMLLFFAGSLAVLDRLEARNMQLQTTFSSPVEGRGYDRLFEHPQYILLGAGEGEYKRFKGVLSSMGSEMHSSAGTLLFSYGIAGLLLYGGIWYLMVSAGPGFLFKLCALTPIVYGITHNGLRFSAAVIATLMMVFGGLAMREARTGTSTRTRIGT